jgi:glycosyltransferase involved in cell wall biosynthesis
VGSDHYRKNQAVLLEAWCAYATHGGHRDLIFVGRSLYEDTFPKLMIEAERRGFADRVHWRNDITDQDLPAVYRLAGVAVAPSRYEGFGMTILEAMASGTPVIAAQNGVYQEVGGEALLSFPAESAQALTHALLSLDDCQAHEKAREKSLAQAAKFTWERCGAETLAAYYAAVQTD